ncbi:hypothetical protein E1298_21415 [Actinomadura rubrisoli]|uniref:Histidine kinase n=1 Tax=Actinomadura rubrisoli TaxID=2530368 RepID=A0A4R5BBH2_9ACTN|nr:hypothetical protein E1298_21415 [Actinomadura rubrisoli]
MQGPMPPQRRSPSGWGETPPEPPPEAAYEAELEQTRSTPQRLPRSPREVRRRPAGARPADRPPLPKRVRQESLATQLKEEAAAEPAPAPQPRAGRSPEEARAMMSSIQQGTRRGRAEALHDEDS